VENTSSFYSFNSPCIASINTSEFYETKHSYLGRTADNPLKNKKKSNILRVNGKPINFQLEIKDEDDISNRTFD